jgi:hypothetical protein
MLREHHTGKEVMVVVVASNMGTGCYVLMSWDAIQRRRTDLLLQQS